MTERSFFLWRNGNAGNGTKQKRWGDEVTAPDEAITLRRRSELAGHNVYDNRIAKYVSREGPRKFSDIKSSGQDWTARTKHGQCKGREFQATEKSNASVEVPARAWSLWWEEGRVYRRDSSKDRGPRSGSDSGPIVMPLKTKMEGGKSPRAQVPALRIGIATLPRTAPKGETRRQRKQHKIKQKRKKHRVENITSEGKKKESIVGECAGTVSDELPKKGDEQPSSNIFIPIFPTLFVKPPTKQQTYHFSSLVLSPHRHPHPYLHHCHPNCIRGPTLPPATQQHHETKRHIVPPTVWRHCRSIRSSELASAYPRSAHSTSSPGAPPGIGLHLGAKTDVAYPASCRFTRTGTCAALAAGIPGEDGGKFAAQPCWPGTPHALRTSRVVHSRRVPAQSSVHTTANIANRFANTDVDPLFFTWLLLL
ncbi:hypothetical protein V8E53_010317 [Lactarius tabidus]